MVFISRRGFILAAAAGTALLPSGCIWSQIEHDQVPKGLKGRKWITNTGSIINQYGRNLRKPDLIDISFPAAKLRTAREIKLFFCLISRHHIRTDLELEFEIWIPELGKRKFSDSDRRVGSLCGVITLSKADIASLVRKNSHTLRLHSRVISAGDWGADFYFEGYQIIK